MFPDLITDDAFRLETHRLWLRWPRAADATSIAKHAGVEAVSRYTRNIPHPYSQADADAFIMSARKGNIAGEQMVMALTQKDKPATVLGTIGLHTRADNNLQLGFWLGQDFWGKGLMAEALDEILALSFVITSAPCIEALVRDDNQASRRLLETRGFERMESQEVSMPLRDGTFACGKFSLKHGRWQGFEQRRFSARKPIAAERPVTGALRADTANRMCA